VIIRITKDQYTLRMKSKLKDMEKMHLVRESEEQPEDEDDA